MITALYKLPIGLQKALAIFLLLIALAIPVFIGFLFWNSYQENALQIKNLREQYGKLEATSLLAEGISDEPISEANVEFLPTASEAALKANLQNRIKSYAAKNGFKIQSMGGAPSFETDGISYVGIRMTGQGIYKSIVGFMLEVEGSLPYLLIEDASLRKINRNSRSDSEQEGELSTQFAIYGAIVKKESSQ